MNCTKRLPTGPTNFRYFGEKLLVSMAQLEATKCGSNYFKYVWPISYIGYSLTSSKLAAESLLKNTTSYSVNKRFVLAAIAQPCRLTSAATILRIGDGCTDILASLSPECGQETRTAVSTATSDLAQLPQSLRTKRTSIAKNYMALLVRVTRAHGKGGMRPNTGDISRNSPAKALFSAKMRVAYLPSHGRRDEQCDESSDLGTRARRVRACHIASECAR